MEISRVGQQQLSDDDLAAHHVLKTTVINQKAALDAAAGKIIELNKMLALAEAGRNMLKEHNEKLAEQWAGRNAQLRTGAATLGQRIGLVVSVLDQLVKAVEPTMNWTRPLEQAEQLKIAVDGAKAVLSEVGSWIG